MRGKLGSEAKPLACFTRKKKELIICTLGISSEKCPICSLQLEAGCRRNSRPLFGAIHNMYACNPYCMYLCSTKWRLVCLSVPCACWNRIRKCNNPYILQ